MTVLVIKLCPRPNLKRNMVDTVTKFAFDTVIRLKSCLLGKNILWVKLSHLDINYETKFSPKRTK